MSLSRNDQGEIHILPFYLTASLICLLCNYRRKNRGRRTRKQTSSLDHHSYCCDTSSAHEPLLASSLDSPPPDLCQATQGTDSLPAVECFKTPVKRHRSVRVDVSSPDPDRAPFRPLDPATNRSRPPFLSPLHSPRKPRNVRVVKPVRAMMDVLLDSRARSDVEDESDDESFRDIARRLGINKLMSTPESPTPPSSRASSVETGSAFSTPTRASKCFSPRRSRRRPGFSLLHAQESQGSPLKLANSPGTIKSWTLATQRDGFWRREAERLRMHTPRILLPSWHLGLNRQEDGEDTERLMTLAEVSLAELELGMSRLDLGPPRRQGFEVSNDRSTADW